MPYSRGNIDYDQMRSGGVQVKTAAYTALDEDAWAALVFNRTSSPTTSITLTLPATPPSPLWKIEALNIGLDPLSISPNGLLLNGASSSITANNGSGFVIWTDGSNYFAAPLGAGSSGGGGGGNTIAWGSLFPNIVSPLNSTFTTLNTGNSFATSQDAVRGEIFMSTLGTPTNFLFNLLKKAVPSTPYVIDMGFVVSPGITSAATNGFGCGLLLRDSATDHVVIMALSATTPANSNARIQRWNSTTTGSFNADLIGTSNFFVNIEFLFFRIADDGVHRTFYVSNDNTTYNQVFQEASGSFITPNEVAMFLLSGNAAQPGGITVFHYREH